ncbi:hypothetical protein [Kineococcus rhizosphaerae]|uniref:Uncharacterized protein n=1 Tax=Kineococcus rhizosphaerae TaxID=559628 RepID=A0A2T0QZ27_9ACTN|nr:hypothetical protein [Kineococcus rhizosphaerae]PRY11773.1 hypothetical protein CLV37_11272 [Kineococcus rhizosphaerae]
MRRLVAWTLLVAGLACAVAGAALLTVFAPAERIDVTERRAEPGVAVVTAPGLLELSGPDVRVTATGASGTGVFVGVARAADATAWLADAERTTVTGVGGDLSDPAATTEVTGTGAAADPRTADIWLASRTGTGSVELTWPTASDGERRDAGGVVVLAATDGTAPAPAAVRLSWHAEGTAASHPAGVPLVVAGGVLALLGAVGVLLDPRRRAAGGRA